MHKALNVFVSVSVSNRELIITDMQMDNNTTSEDKVFSVI